MSSTYLAIDLGAESGRAVAGSFRDGRLQTSVVHRFPNRPVRLLGHLHWNVLSLWDEVKRGVAKAAHSAAPGRLAGIGVDTWAVDYALISRSGAVLANPFHYRDRRTDGVMDAARDTLSPREIFERTGIQFLPFNTLYQLLATQRDEPGLLDSADKLLMIGELMTYFLTGCAVAEFTNASTTQLYDPRRSRWSQELLSAFGLPQAILPDVVPPGTRVGTLTGEVREETGAGRVDVYVPAVHDTGSAVAAVPAEQEHWAFISSGTWSLVGVEVQHPVITDESFAENVTNEGGVAGTFRLLKNVMGLWLLQECRRTWEREGTAYEYSRLVHMAGEAEPFGALIDPDDPRFLAPGDMPGRICAYLREKGRPAPQTPAGIVRCIFESLALKYRHVVERLCAVSDGRVDVVHVVGGGSQNGFLNQMTANATGRPIVAGPVEATAAGNLLMQAVAAGDLGSVAEGRALIARSFSLDRYRPEEIAAWNDAYHHFETEILV